MIKPIDPGSVNQESFAAAFKALVSKINEVVAAVNGVNDVEEQLDRLGDGAAVREDE